MENYKVVSFQDDGKNLEILVSEDTNEAWLSLEQIAILFGRSRTTIYRCIIATYNSHFIESDTVCFKLKHGVPNHEHVFRLNTKVYSIEFVLKLGEDIGSNKAVLLKQFLNNHINDTLADDDNIIVYNNGVVSINVKVSPLEETVWLTQSQMADVFETTRPNITMHIQNIFNENELSISSVSKDFLHTAHDNKQYLVTVYNLDLILAVGYRIKSKRAVEFRRWVSSIMKQYLLKGYVIDSNRASVSYENVMRLENEVARIKEDITDIKSKISEPKEILFKNGCYYDAYDYISKVMQQAESCVTIIDPYFDRKSIIYLKWIGKNVSKRVYFENVGKIEPQEIEMIKKQYYPLNFYKIKDIHDRFIIIDNKTCYGVGTSLNHAGRKVFTINKLETQSIMDTLLQIISEKKSI